MTDPTALVTIEAGIIRELLTTVRRLHMGAEQGSRFARCPTCQLATKVEGLLGEPPIPPPVPRSRPRLVRDTEAE